MRNQNKRRERKKGSQWLILVLLCLSLWSNKAKAADDYIETNVKALAKYGLEDFVEHLVKDGNQAYCSTNQIYRDGFTNAENQEMELVVNKAEIPLMRNQNYLPERLNAAETYYGYKAINDENDPDGEEMLRQSAAVVKMMTPQVECAMKILQLYYIRSTCIEGWGERTGKAENNCVNLYKDGEKIGKSDYTIRELADRIVDVEVKNPLTDKMVFCEKVVITERDKWEKERKALEELPLAIDNQYRTGYIVESVKICPVQSEGTCSNPVYYHPYASGYNSCNWSKVEDQIRIYPFKYPDLFSNKNFCDQDSFGYPNDCERDINQMYLNASLEYVDPAQNNALFIQEPGEQKRVAQKVIETRQDMAGVAKVIEVDSEKNLINCFNCDNKLSQALVKIINATDKNNDFFTKYLNGNGAGLVCGDARIGEQSEEIKTSAYNQEVYESEKKLGPLKPRFNEWCCARWEIVNGKRVCVESYSTLAKVNYWIVAPQGNELKTIEENILGEFYTTATYEKFQNQDSRWNRRLAMQKVATKGGATVPLTIIGGGPITNIFIVQESLYLKSDKNKSLYAILAGCENINNYFLGRCGGGVTSGRPGTSGPGGTSSGTPPSGGKIPPVIIGEEQSFKVVPTIYDFANEPDSSSCYVGDGRAGYAKALECGCVYGDCLATMRKQQSCPWCNGCSCAFIRDVTLQGTGFMKDGTLVRYTGGYVTTEEWKKNPLQLGAGGSVVAFRTFASDPGVLPYGTVLYIPRLDGLTLPNGQKHDGCLIATDTGSAIKGNRIDVFVFNRAAVNGPLSFLASGQSVDAVKNAAKCRGIDYSVAIGF